MTFDYKFENKKIAALGFAVEGESAVDFLLRQKADITVFDEKKEEDFEAEKLQKYKTVGVKFVFGPFGDLTSFDVIVRSPGVNPNIKSLEEARQKGIPVVTGIDIFLNISPAYVIGVTGTKGKGTTSTLIYEMLKKEKSEIYLGGNIGTPPLSFLDILTPQSTVVLELSSFQLFDVTKSPNIAVVLMVTSEHMDFHASEEEYAAAKGNILKFQKPGDGSAPRQSTSAVSGSTELTVEASVPNGSGQAGSPHSYAVINVDYENSRRMREAACVPVFEVSRKQTVSMGAYIKDGALIFVSQDGKKEKIINTGDVFIPGKHNLENIGAAVTVAKILGISNESITEVLKTFKGLKYRLQFVRDVNGVRYYNDSCGTRPESTIAAIRAFRNQKIIILGGSSKGSDFSELAKIISEEKTIKTIIGIGVEWPRIKEALRGAGVTQPEIIENCTSMGVIVETAASEARAGDVVILSPACASFDMFKDYKDRGNQFEEAVLKIKK
ncbi:MAG: UDP-N-acetylmuramoyl-L-alanine--D-glutamate ligase [bacterium]|nr:UDP-N-acetylmuramoyl-L-alanine--D-glutamate ligase [bacterium]